MNTQRATSRRPEEEMSNVGAHDNQVPPQANQVPQLEEGSMGDQVSVVLPQMTDGHLRVALLCPKLMSLLLKSKLLRL